jgi:hypothetical protein
MWFGLSCPRPGFADRLYCSLWKLMVWHHAFSTDENLSLQCTCFIAVFMPPSHTWYSIAVRIVWVHVHKELMWHLTIWRQSCTKPQHRKHVVTVIILNYLSNSCQSLLILVWHSRSYEVQWIRRLWITIRCCNELDTQCLSKYYENQATCHINQNTLDYVCCSHSILNC